MQCAYHTQLLRWGPSLSWSVRVNLLWLRKHSTANATVDIIVNETANLSIDTVAAAGVAVPNDNTKPATTPGISLRPYQEECINKCLELYKQGIRRQAVSLPVGSGKTVVFANLIARLPEPRPGARKVLVLAHREELLAQAQRQIIRFAPHLKVSIEKGRSWSDHEADDVIIASVPTLGRRDSVERLVRFNPQEFKAVIIDEAHHSVAESYLRIMRHFGVSVPDPEDSKESEINLETVGEQQVRIKSKEKGDDKNLSASTLANHPVEKQKSKASISTNPFVENKDLLVWGCSATLSRMDELALGSLFDKIVYHLDIRTLMQEGWLCPAEMCEVYTDSDLRNIKMTMGDFDSRQLSLAIDTPVRNDLVAGMWQKIAREQHKRQATIVFALNVTHARNLAASFAALNVSTALITGETLEAVRQDILQKFMIGEIPVLLNCAVLTEGTDLPITDCVVMTRPTCNTNLYTQMVGRGLRKYDGKDYCLVMDFIDKMRSSSRSLITFPSLLPAKQVTDGFGDEIPRTPNDKPYSTEIDPDSISVKVRRGQSLLEGVASPGHGLAWVMLDRDRFAISSPNKTIMLELHPQKRTLGRLHNVTSERDGRYKRVSYKTSPISAEFEEVHEIIPPLVLELKQEELLRSMRADAHWRKSRPMTPGQRKFISQILLRVPGIDMQKLNSLQTWSVGRASDLITKYYLRYRLLEKPFEHFEDFVAGVEHYH